MAKREWNGVAAGTKEHPEASTSAPGCRQRSTFIEDEDGPIVRRYRGPEDERGSLFDRYPGPRS